MSEAEAIHFGSQFILRVRRFFATIRSTATGRRTISLGLAMAGLWVVAGCRHLEREVGQVATSSEFVGDPATNVMIVPVWASSSNYGGRAFAKSPAAGIITAANTFPFPDYDQRVAKSVHDRWLVLLQGEAGVPRAGKVEVEFMLNSEGYVFGWNTVSDDLPPRVQELCKQAIFEVAPFPKWSPEMMKKIGDYPRSVRFTFHLNGPSKAQ
jgi:hypothetical protein